MSISDGSPPPSTVASTINALIRDHYSGLRCQNSEHKGNQLLYGFVIGIHNVYYRKGHLLRGESIVLQIGVISCVVVLSVSEFECLALCSFLHGR